MFLYDKPLFQLCWLPCLWSSVALPLGINGDERHSKAGRVYPKYPATSTLPYFNLILRADAREERQLSTRERRVAGRPWAGVRPARLCDPQLQRPIHRPRFARFVLGAPPHAPLMRRSRRGRRFLSESRYSLLAYSSSPPAETRLNLRKCNCLSGLKPVGPKTSMASCGSPRPEASARAPPKGRRSTANKFSPIQVPFSAQRGSKTVTGFRTRKTVAAQRSPQFSAPCQPHCGSACAPPHSRRSLGFHLDFAHRKTSEIPF